MKATFALLAFAILRLVAGAEDQFIVAYSKFQSIKAPPVLRFEIYPDGRLFHYTNGVIASRRKVPIQTLTNQLHNLAMLCSRIDPETSDWTVFDAPFERIELQECQKIMNTTHALVERSPKMVFLTTGIRRLARGEKREDVIAKEPQKFQDFRRLWVEVKSEIDAIVRLEQSEESPPKKRK